MVNLQLWAKLIVSRELLTQSFFFLYGQSNVFNQLNLMFFVERVIEGTIQ